jgi:hypothetical protein
VAVLNSTDRHKLGIIKIKPLKESALYDQNE